MIPPARRTTLLFTVGGTATIVWGALISLQPPFYPTLAEIKGATPSQVKQNLEFPIEPNVSETLFQ